MVNLLGYKNNNNTHIIITMRFIFILIFTLIFTTTSSFKDCNFSQFDFFSQYTLGKQNQLNDTFSLLNSRVGVLPDVTYNSSDLLFRYIINSVKSNFYYIDSKQKATIIGNDLIFINGGETEATLSFVWTKNSQKGTGTALCRSNPIAFSKELFFLQGFIRYKLFDYTGIGFYNYQCNITRVDPVLEQKDISVLQVMFNTNDGTNVKRYLQKQIQKYYQQALNESLTSQRQPINNSSQYTWIDPTPGKKNFTINYTLLPVGGHLQGIGLSIFFVTEITNDDDWKCGATVPAIPKDITEFGGVQQYLSLSIFQNTIRYAVQSGILNTQLNRQNWQSTVFQFFAGDLYSIIPVIATKYYADEVVAGECNATTTNLKLTKSSDDNLLLSMHYTCALRIGNTVISQFQVDPNFFISIVPSSSYLDFKVVKANKFVHFKDVGEFKIIDLNIASLFVTRSLQRLFKGKVFGSGWKIYERDYPAVLVEDGVVFIYDKAGHQ